MIWDVLFEILKHFNLFKLIMKSAYLKLSDETSKKIFYLKCLKLETSQTCHGSCLFEAFRWDLKWDVLFENFETWNFSNMSWGVAYLKLSDETWNEICYLKLLKLETSQTCHGELLIWNFQMRLEKEVLFEIFETWNFSNPSWGVAYLKLSDETWKERCYLKFFKLETFQTHHGELLIWNFQMRLEMRCAIWNFWNLKLFKPIIGSCLFETFRWDLKKRCYLKLLKLVTFQIHHGELLI